MRRVSREDFERRFPRRSVDRVFMGSERETVIVDGDGIVDGIPERVVVRRGVFAEVRGLVTGTLVVEADAIVYVSGLVDGPVRLDGALCVTGGHLASSTRGGSDAVVHDPANP